MGAGGVLHSGLVPEIAQSSGMPLPAEHRARAEHVFQVGFHDVRIHTGGPAAQAARRLAARAFTTERDVYFGSGHYMPHTEAGLRLLGHELAHVVQQRRGLSAESLGGTGDAYEREADNAGAAFARGEPVRIASAPGSERGVQRSEDPGAQAGAVGTEDSPYGLPFLGEANTPQELRELLLQLRAEAGGPLTLVDESFAMEGPVPAESARSETGPAVQSLPLERPLQASPLGKPLQRAVVAGCNVPGVPPNVIGIAAHRQIQAGCRLTSPGCRGEVRIPGGGYADLMRDHIPALTEIGEIKPASWLGRRMTALAAAQLARYIAAYNAAYPGPGAVPMWSFRFSPAPFLLNPSQQLSAFGPAAGLYFYRCTAGPRRRVRVPVRVLVRVPVPVPTPAPVPAPTPVPAPAPSHGPSGRDVARGVATAGAGIGIGYLVYRGVRMIPSLFFWPSIPANLAIP